MSRSPLVVVILVVSAFLMATPSPACDWKRCRWCRAHSHAPSYAANRFDRTGGSNQPADRTSVAGQMIWLQLFIRLLPEPLVPTTVQQTDQLAERLSDVEREISSIKLEIERMKAEIETLHDLSDTEDGPPEIDDPFAQRPTAAPPRQEPE